MVDPPIPGTFALVCPEADASIRFSPAPWPALLALLIDLWRLCSSLGLSLRGPILQAQQSGAGAEAEFHTSRFLQALGGGGVDFADRGL
jgi:hypothetical protein